MHWTDEGIVLSVRRHGETSAIASVLTRAHGRHAGLVRGGAGRRLKGVLQPGNEVALAWSGRLAEHLGQFLVEARQAHAARLLQEPLGLAALAAACALVEAAVPEREPHAPLHDAMRVLLERLGAGDASWPELYVRWELGLLAELGFGLDLDRCAATGAVLDLTFVSPKSGRAVSGAAALPYADRLLRLPGFLAAGRGAEASAAPHRDLQDGLALTGWFLERHVFGPHDKAMPAARARLVQRLANRGAAT